MKTHIHLKLKYSNPAIPILEMSRPKFLLFVEFDKIHKQSEAVKERFLKPGSTISYSMDYYWLKMVNPFYKIWSL